MRPGEKLFEELLIGENAEPTDHKHIMRAHETHLEPQELKAQLLRLSNSINERDIPASLQIIKECVSDYEPSPIIENSVYAEQSKD